MKIKPVIDFTDRVTGEKRVKGEAYECDEARAKELIRKGFAAKVVEKKAPAEAKPAAKAKK